LKHPSSEKEILHSSVLPTSDTLHTVDQNNLTIPCDNNISHTSVSSTTTDVREEISQEYDESNLKDPTCVNKITDRSVLPTSSTMDTCGEKLDHMDVDCITISTKKQHSNDL
jgi:hypothetical protein